MSNHTSKLAHQSKSQRDSERARTLFSGVISEVNTTHFVLGTGGAHPAPAFLHVAIQLATAAVLLQKGVEGGEQLGHRSLPLRPTRVHGGSWRSVAHTQAMPHGADDQRRKVSEDP
jgi:hypothetical protein